MSPKAKINKWDGIKLASFCKVKGIMTNVKRQHTDWEKTTAKQIFDKGLNPKYIQNSYNSAEKKKQSNYKWAEVQP